MKIALADGIWSRLYGPYGNRSVNTQLIALSEQWDIAVAEELFWEELHHQDDIYPSTFASLPWLLEFSPSTDEAFEETHLFLSHIIHCAFCEAGAGKYRGLSTEIADHHHSWIPQSEWLTIEDQPILAKLAQWFSDNYTTIAKRCLSLVGSDLVISAYAIEGFASANGGSRVAWSTQRFANGEEVDLISRELGAYDYCNTMVVAKLYPHVQERNPEMASFLLNYPGCTFSPNDQRQINLF